MSGRYTVQRPACGGRRTSCTTSAPSSHEPTESTKPSCSGRRLLAEEVNLVAEPGERLGQLDVVHVRTGSAEQVAVKDEDPHAPASLWKRRDEKSGIGRPGQEAGWRLAILPRRETARAVQAARARIGEGGRLGGRRRPARRGGRLLRPRHRRADGHGRQAGPDLQQPLEPASRPGVPAHLPPLRSARRPGPERLPVLPQAHARPRAASLSRHAPPGGAGHRGDRHRPDRGCGGGKLRR